MPEIYFTADTHFGHANILKHESISRPFSSIEEHDEVLIERWNAVVKPKDTVWHLGDFIWRIADIKTIGRLNGHIKLVLGNHDLLSTSRYLEVIKKVYGSVEYKNRFVLTHIPVHPSKLMTRSAANLHGHLHSKNLDDPRYVNVGVDQWNLSPVSWEVIKGKLDAIKG